MSGGRQIRTPAPPAHLRLAGPRSAVAMPRRAAGDPYSRRVARLKLLLPAIGLALLLLVAAWPRLAALFESVRVGLSGINLREARELKMVDPRYAGIDRQNRPYVLTAAIGRQMPDRTDLVSLSEPRARMTTSRGSVVVAGATGIYQSQAKLLDLFRRVTLVRQDGTRFSTASAHVDFSDNSARGHEPIRGHGPWGALSAQGFRILDRGERVIFTGHAHLVLRDAAPRAKPAAPPSLPPAVAAQAAAIERVAAAAGQFPRRRHPISRRPAPVARRARRHHAG